jgi:large subunit ribosomal protein L18
MLNANNLRARRKQRTRTKLRKQAGGRPRFSVFRSNKNIYAQIIDDGNGRTLASASTLEKDVRAAIKSGATSEAATAVGKLVAERAVAGGLGDVVFDRGAYRYHGRVRALADAAREAGLKF